MSAHNKQKKEVTRNDRAVLDGLRYALNHYPLHRRIVFAVRLVLGRF